MLYGSAAGLTADRDQLWYAGVPGLPALASSSGFGVLAVGDFDADGFDDLAVGIPGARVAGVTEAGQVLVLRGSATGLTATGARIWDQTSPGVASAPEEPAENWSGESFGVPLRTRAPEPAPAPASRRPSAPRGAALAVIRVGSLS